MKNYKRIVLIILCMLSISANAQLAAWTKDIETEIQHNGYIGFYEAKNICSIKTTDNSIISVFNFKENDNEYLNKKQFRYDSVAISKVDFNGNIIWIKKYSIPNSGRIEDICEMNNGGVALCGVSGTNNVFYKLDANGNIVFSKLYTNPQGNFFFKKIKQTQTGGFSIASLRHNYSHRELISAFEYLYYYNSDYTVGCIDSIGNVLWNKNAATVVTKSLFETKYDQLEYYINYDFTIAKTNNQDLISIAILRDYEPTTNNENDNYITLFQYDDLGNSIQGQALNNNQNTTNDETILFYKQLNNQIFVYKHCYYCSNLFSYTLRSDASGNNIDTFQNSVIKPINHYSKLPDLTYHQNKDSSSLLFFTGDQYTTGSIPTVVKNNKNNEFEWTNQYALTNPLLVSETPDSAILLVSTSKNISNGKQTLQFTKVFNKSNSLFYKAYVDINNNNIFDGNDYYYKDASIELSIADSIITFPLKNDGTLNIFVRNGTYKSKIISFNQQLRYYTIFPDSTTTNFPTENGTCDTIIFRLVPINNIQDLQAGIIPITNVRPGFQSSYAVYFRNVGTKTMHNLNFNFKKDIFQSFDTAYRSPSRITADSIIWLIDSIAPNQTISINIVLLNATPPTLNANDTLHLAAQIFPMENDSFVQDNYASLNQIVRNSVDPNDKIETHGGTIPYSAVQNREYLYYTIRFQNTGNSYATRIVITDTLTENVDASTFEFLSSSVPFVMNVVNRKHITWTAANTYLPDSTSDEANSYGYISFRIKPKAGLLPSDEITNRASIVFDYNTAISTNTCTTKIIEQRILSIKNNEIKSIHLFPNPTNGNVQLNMNLSQNKNYTLRIIDINGNLLLSETLKGNSGENNVTLELNSYSNGIYFIQIRVGNENLFYGKVIKQ